MARLPIAAGGFAVACAFAALTACGGDDGAAPAPTTAAVLSDHDWAVSAVAAMDTGLYAPSEFVCAVEQVVALHPAERGAIAAALLDPAVSYDLVDEIGAAMPSCIDPVAAVEIDPNNQELRSQVVDRVARREGIGHVEATCVVDVFVRNGVSLRTLGLNLPGDPTKDAIASNQAFDECAQLADPAPSTTV